jgi:hypothetical protein
VKCMIVLFHDLLLINLVFAVCCCCFVDVTVTGGQTGEGASAMDDNIGGSL